MSHRRRNDLCPLNDRRRSETDSYEQALDSALDERKMGGRSREPRLNRDVVSGLREERCTCS